MSLAVVLFFAMGTFCEVYLLTVVSGHISIINTLLVECIMHQARPPGPLPDPDFNGFHRISPDFD